MLMSLLTLYNDDNTILSGLTLPDGCNSAYLIPQLLAETAELEIIYPQPAIFKIVFDAWVQSRYPSWARMMAALTEEYNPLHNYNRDEIWNENLIGKDTENVGRQSARTIERETEETGSYASDGSSVTNDDTVNSVAGFNSTSYTPKDKSERDADTTTEGIGSDNTFGAEDTTESLVEGVEGTTNRDHTTTHSSHVEGNIGVTTSAQMLAEEINVRANDLYQIIIAEFKRKFCIMVY